MARSLFGSSIALLVVTMAAAQACKTFDLPAEICDPSTLDAKDLTPAGDTNCGRCLEENCCDAVGVCERKEGCAAIVHGVHECVLSKGIQGARYETECSTDRGLALLEEANDAYRCMRDRCGGQCGLPVCQVEKAAALIQSAKCDQCFAGACCAELNACYESRACKLMIECISASCGAELGESMTALTAGDSSALGQPSSRLVPDEYCAAPFPAPGSFLPRCVHDCLCKYKDNDQGLPPTNPELVAFTLGQRIYECGALASCGADCSPPTDAGTD